MIKREAATQGQNLWDKRLGLVKLKWKFPSLGVKEDEELLHDKGQVLKHPRTDSTFMYAFHPDLLAEVWSDIVDRAASCLVSGSGLRLMVAIWSHFLHMRKPLIVQGSGQHDPERDRT
jgi:hypothetical protein